MRRVSRSVIAPLHSAHSSLKGMKPVSLRTHLLFLLATVLSFLPNSSLGTDLIASVVSALDGDTIEVLHFHSPCTHPPPAVPQRHPKEWSNLLNRKNGEGHILACHYYLSYGNHKIRAASPTNTPTKPPKAMPISMITS